MLTKVGETCDFFLTGLLGSISKCCKSRKAQELLLGLKDEVQILAQLCTCKACIIFAFNGVFLCKK